MFFTCTSATNAAFRKRLLRFLPLLESKWLLNPLLRLIFPVAVTLKRFAAARLVLILGTSFS